MTVTYTVGFLWCKVLLQVLLDKAEGLPDLVAEQAVCPSVQHIHLHCIRCYTMVPGNYVLCPGLCICIYT